MNKRELKAEVIDRSYDGSWQVVTPASLTRLYETSRELVKDGEAVDLTRWITVHVTNNQRNAKKWLDTHAQDVVKLGTLYEVA